MQSGTLEVEAAITQNSLKLRISALISASRFVQLIEKISKDSTKVVTTFRRNNSTQKLMVTIRSILRAVENSTMGNIGSKMVIIMIDTYFQASLLRKDFVDSRSVDP